MFRTLTGPATHLTRPDPYGSGYASHSSLARRLGPYGPGAGVGRNVAFEACEIRAGPVRVRRREA
jgi:hypothetical protein